MCKLLFYSKYILTTKISCDRSHVLSLKLWSKGKRVASRFLETFFEAILNIVCLMSVSFDELLMFFYFRLKIAQRIHSIESE